MGGYGSGWKGAKKETVESCLVLSITDLIRKKALIPGRLRRGTLVWRYEGMRGLTRRSVLKLICAMRPMPLCICNIFDAGMTRPAEKVPIEAALMAPFLLLRKLIAQRGFGTGAQSGDSAACRTISRSGGIACG